MKKFLRNMALAAAWIGLFVVFRRPLTAAFAEIYQADPNFRAMPFFDWVLMLVIRVSLIIPAWFYAYGIERYLLMGAADAIVPDRYRRQDKDCRPSKRPMLTRVFCWLVVFLVMAPAGWIKGAGAGALALMLIAVTVLGIQMTAAIGVGEAFGSVAYQMRRKQSSDGFGVLLILFELFVLFMAFHASYYSTLVWFDIISFEVARHRLLRMHAFILWVSAPLYVIGAGSRRVLINFIKLNLWFVPWPKLPGLSKPAAELSGGAGATRSI